MFMPTLQKLLLNVDYGVTNKSYRILQCGTYIFNAIEYVIYCMSWIYTFYLIKVQVS